ncbi:hypothetical protein MVES1_002878 [Malassezia vespertilionis]|uniref:Major facilitator superfamily (MFS) profile domain-containing protein n=1 Tax=Malassezia vespertilionis TaxID=2020962 RepID=A0A2N1JAH1_9BASI|nr:uncharacterized protein MVES1_002878 [Malassezia vespertilionis]PKI83523.1 hypothetical protein MVES_002725 [Malassezia vespertilionis]WFD07512.1 hypothetical protein MVES1_002878 [Malassezia vespertilionis]
MSEEGHRGELIYTDRSSKESKETWDVENDRIPADEVPDGGLMAWLQVVGAFFFLFNTSGIINSFGIFQTYYEGSILEDKSASSISWIGSIQAFLVLFVGALTGPLFDMGYFRVMTVIGTVFITFAMMMVSISTKYWHFILAQSLCFGFAGACLFVPGIAIVSTYFSKNRVLAIGIATSGSSIGAVVYTVLFRKIVNKPEIGFGWTARILGFFMLGTLLISNVTLRPRVPASHRRSLFVVGAVKEPASLIFLFGILLGYMGAYIPYYHATAYAMRKAGASEPLGYYLVAIINGASAFGRIIPSILADRIGPFNTLAPMAIASAILAFCWLGIKNVPGMCVFTILYGFFTGAYVSLPPSCVASLTNNLHEMGARVGICFLFAGVGMLVGNPIAGALVDLDTDSFWKAQVCCGALVTGSAACLTLSKFILNRHLMAKV